MTTIFALRHRDDECDRAAERIEAALSQRQELLQQSLIEDFMAQLRKPLDYPCLLSDRKERGIYGGERTIRHATVLEFLTAETVNVSSEKGLDDEAAVALLIRAAKGEDIAADALAMFRRAAQVYADERMEQCE